jgi:hypothetical protein
MVAFNRNPWPQSSESAMTDREVIKAGYGLRVVK